MFLPFQMTTRSYFGLFKSKKTILHIHLPFFFFQNQTVALFINSSPLLKEETSEVCRKAFPISHFQLGEKTSFSNLANYFCSNNSQSRRGSRP